VALLADSVYITVYLPLYQRSVIISIFKLSGKCEIILEVMCGSKIFEIVDLWENVTFSEIYISQPCQNEYIQKIS
jgi:hypothetical protein